MSRTVRGLVCALAVAASLSPAPAVAVGAPAAVGSAVATPAGRRTAARRPPVRATRRAAGGPVRHRGWAPARCAPPAADGAPAGPPPAALRLAAAHRIATGRGSSSP